MRNPNAEDGFWCLLQPRDNERCIQLSTVVRESLMVSLPWEPPQRSLDGVVGAVRERRSPGTKCSTSFFQLSAVTFGIATASQNVKLVSSCALNLRLAVFRTAKSPRLTPSAVRNSTQ